MSRPIEISPPDIEPYRKGMELAVDEVNAAGGAAGRRLELVIRDDGGTPGDAVRVAEELISREKVHVLMGTFASHVGLAVSNLAAQRRILFVASEPLTDKLVWDNGNRYTFRLRPSTYMQTAMLDNGFAPASIDAQVIPCRENSAYGYSGILTASARKAAPRKTVPGRHSGIIRTSH